MATIKIICWIILGVTAITSVIIMIDKFKGDE